MRLLYIKTLNNLILFFLCCFLIGEYNEHITAVKNIGIYVALLFCIAFVVLNFEAAKQNLARNFKDNKILLVSFFLLFAWILIISAFAYDTISQTPVFLALNKFKRAVIFILIILFWYDLDKRVSKYFFYAMILAFALDNVHFLLKSIESGNFTFKAIDAIDSSQRLIDRNYAVFFDKLFIFSFLGFFILKDKFKILILFMIVLGIPCFLLVLSYCFFYTKVEI